MADHTYHRLGVGGNLGVPPMPADQGQSANPGTSPVPAAADHVHPGGVPVGAVMPYVGANAPAGWLICNGASFSSGTYPLLATLLGGTTLPDMRGRMFAGYDSGQAEFNTLRGTGGSKTSTAIHTHTFGTGNQDHNHAHGFTTDPGGNHFHLASIASLLWSSSTSHNHQGHPGYASEAPTPDSGVPTTVPVNVVGVVDHTHTGGTTGIDTNHAHGGTTDDSNVTASAGNLPPYFVGNWIIRAA